MKAAQEREEVPMKEKMCMRKETCCSQSAEDMFKKRKMCPLKLKCAHEGRMADMVSVLVFGFCMVLLWGATWK